MRGRARECPEMPDISFARMAVCDFCGERGNCGTGVALLALSSHSAAGDAENGWRGRSNCAAMSATVA